MYENDEFCPETDPILEHLIELLGKIPKELVTMLNVPKYAEVVTSVSQIVDFVRQDCPDAEVSVYFDELTGTSLCLKIIADELNVYKIKEFCAAIEVASTMCVIPRIDSRVEIGFTYEDTKLFIAPIGD